MCSLGLVAGAAPGKCRLWPFPAQGGSVLFLGALALCATEMVAVCCCSKGRRDSWGWQEGSAVLQAGFPYSGLCNFCSEMQNI